MRKLQRLKTVLMRWNQQTYGDITERIKQLKIEVIQAIKGSANNMEDIQALQQLNEKESQLIQAVTEHNILFKLKIRSVWVSEGDGNSKFMHAIYKAKVNRSLIMEL